MLIRKGIYLGRVLRNQWLSKSNLRKFQLNALNELFEASKMNVPFYFKRLPKFKPINTFKDFRKFPIISREEYLNAGLSIYNKKFKFGRQEDLRERATSGSTGVAFKIKYDERAYDYLETVYARAFFSQGYNPLFPMAYYWYEPLKAKTHNRLGLFRRQYIPCDWPIGEQIKELIRLNSRYIHYFSSALYYIARIITPRDAAKIRPRLIITHAELLSPKMKARISKVFKCPVYDMYGTTEFVRMAWECPTCGEYHVEEDSIILEILDENNNPCEPGQMGRFVVTGLANYLLPLIRYEMGDYGSWSTKNPKCGRGLRLIEGVEGRKDDFLVSTSGNKTPPKQVIDALDGIEELAIFKVTQTGEADFVVEYKLKMKMNLPNDKITSVLKQLVGSSANISLVESSPKFSKRGKLRLVQKCL